MILYLESSAVLAWLLGEPRGAAVRSAVDSAQTVVTSVVTLVESHRALVRAEHATQISAADRQRLKGLLARAQRGWVLMEVSAEVRARVEEPFPVEPLRTLDALHLATALLFARVYPDLEVISHDQRLVENARALGLDVRPVSGS